MTGDTDTDTFYQQLQAEVDAIPRHDLTTIIGDLNSKIRSDNIYCDKAMEMHRCSTRNEDGERLIDLCNINNLVIGGTLFPHQDIHKVIWCPSSGRGKNQIDQLMINGIWKCLLLDVRVNREADVGSDHHLMTAFIKFKLRSAGHRMRAQRCFDTEKLRDPKVKSTFVLQVKNRFQAMQNLEEEAVDPGTEINRRWERVATVYTGSTEECLGFWQRGKKNEWMRADTWKTIDNKCTLKKKLTDAKSE